MATWRSGYAADCKSVYSGSIPDVASRLPSSSFMPCRRPRRPTRLVGVRHAALDLLAVVQVHGYEEPAYAAGAQMTDFVHARRVMVDSQIRPSSVTDRRLIAALGHVPRELFVPPRWRELAYLDTELPVNEDVPPRRLSAPAVQARLIQLAAIGPDDRVLDLGCASGYSAALIASLAGSVVAVEPDAALAASARVALEELGVENVVVRQGPIDGAGAADGPFDAIVIEAAVERVPTALISQLREGGRIAAFVGTGPTAVAHLFVRQGRDLAGRAEFDARLPALATGSAEERFVF